jgi:hypothetical protein
MIAQASSTSSQLGRTYHQIPGLWIYGAGLHAYSAYPSSSESAGAGTRRAVYFKPNIRWHPIPPATEECSHRSECMLKRIWKRVKG